MAVGVGVSDLSECYLAEFVVGHRDKNLMAHVQEVEVSPTHVGESAIMQFCDVEMGTEHGKHEKNGGDCYSKTEQTVTVLMAQN